jgi:hypothetical protein
MPLFFLVLILFSVYTYALVDPNITLINHPVWTTFRNAMVQFGYYQRPLSTVIYLILVILLFFASYKLFKIYKVIPILKLSAVIGLITLFAYPFLSHDFFNYLFSAKIVMFYHKNPYIFVPLNFPHDPWLRFMHWTHAPYVYGPIFLLLVIIPTLFTFGKFILSFLFLKGMYSAFYISSVYALSKLDKKVAVFFATSPLVIIEGLINAHNDFIALSFAILGIYLLSKNQNLKSKVLFVLSFGIKYMTAGILFIKKKRSKVWDSFIFLLLILPIIWLTITQEIQPWYFLNIMIIPILYPRYIKYISILSAGLLLSYIPFILYGNWGIQELFIKHFILSISLIAMLLLYIFEQYYKKNLLKK